MQITQDQIRNYLQAKNNVSIQIAGPDDGSPQIAWGDSFFSICKPDSSIAKMPFATIVTLDYDDFDCESQLNRGELYRLNLDVGKLKFQELFSLAPSEFEVNRSRFDFAAIDEFIPHPVYATYCWISIISPTDRRLEEVYALLDYSLLKAIGHLNP